MQPTITKVDPREGTVTVKMEDKKGKEVEKIFHLTEDVEYLDSTGRVATLDVFQCGDAVLLIEMEGKIKELKRATPAPSGRTVPKTTTPTAVASGDKNHNAPLVTADEIRLCAYRKWESAGKPAGDGVQYWLDAEEELKQGK
jgi:hypothetical protein